MLQKVENLEKLENLGKKLKCRKKLEIWKKLEIRGKNGKNLEIWKQFEYLKILLKWVEKFGNVEKLRKKKLELETICKFGNFGNLKKNGKLEIWKFKKLEIDNWRKTFTKIYY